MVKAKAAAKPASAQKTTDKPANNLKKVEKASAKSQDIDAKMIIGALKELRRNNVEGHGFALVSIRKHIFTTSGLHPSKERQAKIKAVIEEQFSEGRIIMTNHKGPKIHFLKRFDVAEGNGSSSSPSSPENNSTEE